MSATEAVLFLQAQFHFLVVGEPKFVRRRMGAATRREGRGAAAVSASGGDCPKGFTQRAAALSEPKLASRSASRWPSWLLRIRRPGRCRRGRCTAGSRRRDQRPLHYRCPTPRDFVPWCISDAGLHGAGMGSSSPASEMLHRFARGAHWRWMAADPPVASVPAEMSRTVKEGH
jgi:hypothetical protein